MRIYCINLTRRADRWAECLEIFAKQGLEVERFEGIDGNPGNEKLNGATDGDIGCTLSHYELVKKLKKEGIKEALILEDDVEFIEDFQFTLSQILPNAPEDFDMIWFGGNHVEKPVKSIAL